MHGPIMQLGYVVGDLATSAEQWNLRTGAGPFFHMPSLSFEGWTYQGKSQDMVLNIAFAQLADKMIELIEPAGPWPSVYGTGPLKPGDCRPHHHAFLVRDLDAAASSLGSSPPTTTARVSPQAELRYYDCRNSLGLFVELITDCEDTRAFFELAESAARQWDGSGPLLRPLPAGAELNS